MLRNSVRNKGDSRSLSWPSQELSVRHNMIDSGMISGSPPEPDD